MKKSQPDHRNPFRIAQGLLLFQQRSKTGKFLAQAAKEIGVAESTLCRWESGHSSPPGEHLYKLAQLYKCSIQELFPKKF